jgi:nitrite reductase/ring-hydroxylating ferredoxin subunit
MSEASHSERKIPHAGTYSRELPVSIERLYENAIDWEHLPYLHRSTFSRIECIEAGTWGFRARTWTQPHDERRSFVIELRFDRELRRKHLRWITSTLDGPGTGTEIWTHAFAMGEQRTDIVVDFFVPGLDAARRAEVGRYYINLYTRLYDEDVSMMSERQAQLDSAGRRVAPHAAPMPLGSLAEVRARLPITIEHGGRKFRIVESDGDLIAYSTLCPHLLGPLGDGEVRAGIVECPWHGYRYDIRTRRCVSGANCDLSPAPNVIVGTDSRVMLEFH